MNRLFFIAIGLLLAIGCGQNDVKVYSVAKDQPKAESQPAMPPGHPDLSEAPAAPAAPALQWKTPDGWKEMPAGEMRVASFKVTGTDGKQADVSVIPLPGDAGGDFSNVNRWRDQVGQPPVTEAEFKKLAEPVELAGQPAVLYEQDGHNSAGAPTSILAVIQHHEGMSWFFKMTGDTQVVAQEKPTFVTFLKSFQFVAGEAPGALPPGHPDISAMPPPSAAAPAMSSGAGRPSWNIPAGWKEIPGGQFLVAKFSITGDGNSQAAVNVSSSPGTGGGLTANVNRWRKQLGLGELPEADVANSTKSIETKGGQAVLVTMSGTDARSGRPTSLVGVIVAQPQQTWFYKLMGDAPAVTAQSEAFTKFVQEAQY